MDDGLQKWIAEMESKNSKKPFFSRFNLIKSLLRNLRIYRRVAIRCGIGAAVIGAILLSLSLTDTGQYVLHGVVKDDAGNPIPKRDLAGLDNIRRRVDEMAAARRSAQKAPPPSQPQAEKPKSNLVGDDPVKLAKRFPTIEKAIGMKLDRAIYLIEGEAFLWVLTVAADGGFYCTLAAPGFHQLYPEARTLMIQPMHREPNNDYENGVSLEAREIANEIFQVKSNTSYKNARTCQVTDHVR